MDYPGGGSWNYDYDADMNVTSATDPDGNTTTFTYNTLDRRVGQTDPMGNATSFSYDQNGNRLSVTDPAGNVTQFSYDLMNRLLSVTDPARSVTSYTRDLRGLVTTRTDPLGNIATMAYDADGKLTSKTDRNGTALTYSYTPTGKLESITYPDQSQVTYGYDSFKRLNQIQDSLGTSSIGYDAAGRVTSYTDANGFILGYAYDQYGNRTQVTYPDSSQINYSYDALNRMTTVSDQQGHSATYTYDTAGNVAVSTQFNGIINTYSYDAANRLLGMQNPVASYQFTLDLDGNRIHAAQSGPLSTEPPAVATTYGYNTQKNRLLSARLLNYTYDDEGQLSSVGGIAYTFDADHRLAGIGTDTQFSYDGRGNRLSATRAGVTSHYVYDPWGNLVAIADASNNITQKLIYGKGLLAMATSSGLYCYHFNGIGSTIGVTDMNQSAVDSYAYDPFGAVLNQQETVPQPFKFVGQYGVMAEPNGLYYMRARYYDPTLGRFVSEDPLRFAGGDVNLYGYVLNNPVNLIDPTGLFKFNAEFLDGLAASANLRVSGIKLEATVDFGTQHTTLYGPDYVSQGASISTEVGPISPGVAIGRMAEGDAHGYSYVVLGNRFRALVCQPMIFYKVLHLK